MTLEAVAAAQGGIGRRARTLTDGVLPAPLVVALAASAWAVSFGLLAALRHERFLTQRFDTGSMTQAVWNTAHGHLLEVTDVAGEQVNRLGIHLDPILVLFAPLWWIWPSPVMLLAVQALALALGALPVFWLARKHLGSERAGAKLALVYLLFPPLQWNVIHEFHPVALAVPLLLFAVWYLDERRLVPFGLCAFAATLTKEQIGLMIAIIGIWHAARSRAYVEGLAIAAIAGASTAIAAIALIPHFSDVGSHYDTRYRWIGGSASGIARTLVTDPEQILSAIARPSNGLYAIFLLLPVLGICLLSPLILASAPQVALSVLSERLGDTDFTYQNALPVIPILIAATVFGAGRIARNPNAAANRILFASIVMALAIGPARFIPALGEIAGAEDTTLAPVAAQRAAVALVPKGAPVSTTNNLGGHLSARRYVYEFPVIAHAEWIAVDTDDPWLPTPRASARSGIVDGFDQPRRMDRLISALRRDRSWTLVFEEGGVLVFRRT